MADGLEAPKSSRFSEMEWSMAHKIAVVTGSPRVKGNSSLLAAAFIEGAQEAGCEVVRMDAGRASIAGCLGCEYCFSHEGACCQDDDMQEFYPLLRECDTIVYVTPIYTFSWSAQIKAFIDRMFCGIAKPFGIKQAALLTCYEDKDASIAQHLVNTYRAATAYCKWENLGEVCVNGVYEKGAIAGNPGLDKARELGASLGK